MQEKKRGISRVMRATCHSVHGLLELWRSHISFKQEVAFIAITLPLMSIGAFYYHSHPWVMLAYMVMASLLILLMEGINSAIEILADRITKEKDEAIKKAKDIGSALVFLALLNYVGIVVLLLCTIMK